MKRILTAILIVTAMIFADARLGAPSLSERPLFAQGKIKIQLTEAAQYSGMLNIDNSTKSYSMTGVESLDDLNMKHSATAMKNAHMGAKNAAMEKELGLDRWYLLEIPKDKDVLSVVEDYKKDPNIEFANPEYLMYTQAIPNDTYHVSHHWGHNNTAQMLAWKTGDTYNHTGLPVGTVGFDTNAHAGWDGTQGYGSTTVVIGIIDSGVDTAHEDITDVAGYDFGDGDTNPMDNSAEAGHGTCCAGVAAGIANNGKGVAGTAGACKIMPLKVADSAGSMAFTSIEDALIWGADNGADVLSMSLGAAISPGYSPATDAAILYAYNAGSVVMAATGNENATTVSYPANHANCLAVGAASPDGLRKDTKTIDGEYWWGSNYGTTTADGAGAVDFLAPTILPATDITGTAGYQTGNYYLYFNGTSCATPYAAGFAALIKSKFPTYTPAQVAALMKSTAIDVETAGWDKEAGYGMINLQAALNAGGTAPAVPTLVSPTNGSSTSDLTPTFDWNDASGATSYTIQIDNTSNFSSPEYTNSPTVSTYTPAANLAVGTWYWRVLATNTYGSSAYTTGWSVILGNAPAAPTLLLPANGSSTTDQTPTFDWSDASGATSYTIQVDNNSDFSTPEATNSPTTSTYTPGANLAYGTYYWRVLATNAFGSSAYTASWSVIIGTVPAAPTLLLPANASSTSDLTPTFDWSDVSGATSYTIQIDNTSNFSSPEYTNSPTVSTYTPAANLAVGTWYWRVLTTNTFGSSAYTTGWSVILGNAPAVPTLLLPADASSTTDQTPTFDWNDVSGATSYTILVDNDIAFGSPEINQSPTVSTYTPAANLTYATYYWKVMATNAFGSSVYSGSWSVIIGSVPAAPTLLLPANASSTSDLTPTFDWSDVSGATSYTIQIDNTSNFSSPEYTNSPTVSTYTPTANFAVGTWYWRVLTTNTFGSSAYTTGWSVILGNAPAVPTLLLPADASLTTDQTPAFDWSDVSGATSYTIQADNNSDFSSPEVTNSPAVSTYTQGTNLAYGTYYWRVLATNAFGSSVYTASWSLIIGTVPGAPTLLSPSDLSSTMDQTPAFDWSDVSLATSYTILVDNNSNFSSPEINQSPAVSNFTPASNLAEGTYYWKVLSTNGFGASSYSSAWSFTIAIPNITLSTTQVNTTAAPEGTDSDSFNINNTGTLNLDYSITKAYVAKGSKADITVESNDFAAGLGDYTNSGTATWTATAGQAVVSNGTTTNLTGILTSGSFDGTGCTSLTLTFDQVFTTAGLSTATVEYYNGTAWTQIYTAGASTSVSQSLALPVIAANMQLRFNCAVRKNSTDSWSIDNIVVSGPAAGPTYTWLNINSALTGSVTPAGSNAINITCDAAGLAVGIYNANITVASNDPDEPNKVLPVQFTVEITTVVPGVPSNVRTSVVGTDIVVDWDSAANATSYDVYSSVYPYGTFTFVTNVATNQYTTTYTEGKKFWYIVAKNATK
jgi:subtilisin family serine protease